MLILQAVLLLLGCQLAGEIISKVAHIPIPGPVLGMVLLAGWYIASKREPEEHVEKTANGLLGWLGLLFVPAGVGIVANMELLRAAWLSVSVSLIASTLATLIITAAVMNRLMRRRA